MSLTLSSSQRVGQVVSMSMTLSLTLSVTLILGDPTNIGNVAPSFPANVRKAALTANLIAASGFSNRVKFIRTGVCVASLPSSTT